MKQKYIVIYTTLPNLSSAKKLVGGMVKARIAACGNIFKISSIYRWQGKIEKSPEYGVFIKTRRTKYRVVENYIKENHPYRVPEIISWEIDQGLHSYLKWIDTETRRH
jgi:periplasmic divalent cation tolerance protein